MNLVLTSNLNSLGVKPEAYSASKILVLPEGFATKAREYFETTDMVGFVKALKRNGAAVFTLMDAGVDVPSMDRRANERWLGLVWVRDVVAIPLLVAVIGTYASNRIEDARSESVPPAASTKIHIELVIGVNGEKSLKYEGDPEGLVKILETMKLTNGK